MKLEESAYWEQYFRYIKTRQQNVDIKKNFPVNCASGTTPRHLIHYYSDVCDLMREFASIYLITHMRYLEI